MATAQLVGGYHAIALPLEHSAFHRYIYAKKHNVKDSEATESALAADRTVYFVNLPATADEPWLRACLEPTLGSIQHIVTGGIKATNSSTSSNSSSTDAPVVAKTAHVVFKSKGALKKALSIQQLTAPASTSTTEAADATGLARYVQQYRATKPGLAAVKAIADAYMSKFDADEEADLRQREALKATVDADGFQTVVNAKKRSIAAAEDLTRPAKKQKQKEIDTFYRFQMRERKRDQLKTLRERFEEDRVLVEKLKQANRFKPE